MSEDIVDHSAPDEPPGDPAQWMSAELAWGFRRKNSPSTHSWRRAKWVSEQDGKTIRGSSGMDDEQARGATVRCLAPTMKALRKAKPKLEFSSCGERVIPLVAALLGT